MPYPTITERSGSQSATGLGVETTFGQATAATTFLPMMTNGMEYDPGWFSPELMMNVRDKQVFNLVGESKNLGSIEGPLFPSNAIPLLVAAIGTDAVTGTATPYTHTISQANTLPSLTVEKNIGGYQSLQFAGCRVGKFTVKAPAGNSPVTLSADMSGQSVAVLSSPTSVSITNELPWVFSEASFSLGGNARADVTNVELTIDNGLKETWTYSGHTGPSFITPVNLHCSGTVDVVWSSLNATTYGDFTTLVNQTLGSLSVTFAHPGASGYSVAFTFPQVALAKYGNDLKSGDVVMSSWTWEASKPLTGASQYTVQAVVMNGVSTAYTG